VVVVLLGVLVMVLRFTGQEDAPPTGVDPSEPSTGPTRPPELPGDATVVVTVTSSKPMLVACFKVPNALHEKDRKACEHAVTKLRRKMRIEGRLAFAQAVGEAGPEGAEVRCRITVDGEVQARDANSGAWQWAACTAHARLS